MAKFDKIIIENEENHLIKKFISFFKQKIRKKKKGRFSFVLTGGESPIKLYKELSYMDVLSKGLKVMDSTAISLCMDNKLPIVMFDLMASGNVRSILAGESVGTLVS